VSDRVVTATDSIASKTTITPKLEKSTPQTSRTTEGELKDKISWGGFHAMVDLKPPSGNEKTRANADIALARAKEMGILGWEFSSNSKNFVRK
jgi:hypothetical protein